MEASAPDRLQQRIRRGVYNRKSDVSSRTAGMGMIKFTRFAVILLSASVLAGAGSSARAQAPAAVIPAPRFDIERFEINANTLLSPDEVGRIVEPYTGKNKDFADIQRALEALEQVFRDRGYGAVQVLLPEQDITRGVVRFHVLQPKVGRVVIEGNTHFDAANIRHSLPSVKEGETPNSKDIARNLQITAEHPVKQTNVLLKSGASDEQVDINIKVTDDKPWRGFLILDNTGTTDTGNYRLGIGFQHSNVFNSDHVFTAQYVTSPTELDQVSVYGVGYRIPFYGLNSSLELIAGYSDVDSGTVQGLFNVSGKGSIGSARWNYYLPKSADYEHRVAFGLDYRAFENQVLFEGTSIVPDVTVHPASLTYSGLWRGTASELSFYASGAKNIPGGKNGDDAAFQASRPGASADYSVFRYGFNYVRQFQNEWQTRLGFGGQYTRDPLVSGEQFGIGGPDSVRGYDLRELANDRGMAAQLELYTPDFARNVGLSDSYKLRLLGFFDYGSVSRVDPLPDETTEAAIKSAGIGLRLGYSKSVVLRLDLAQILKDTAIHDAGSQRLTGAIALIF
jgi:hemolysin activation/secretion protein